MIDLTYNLNCPDNAREKAQYFLELFAGITGIHFKPGSTDADIIYSLSNNARSLTIPFRNLSDSFNWHTVAGNGFKLKLPDSIDMPLYDDYKRSLTFDIFTVLASYLENRLAIHNKPGELGKNNPGFLQPELSDYINYILHVLKLSGKIPDNYQIESPWPNRAPFALGLSHDIDILRRKIPGSLMMLAKAAVSYQTPGGMSGSFKGLIDSANSKLLGKTNPYCQFERLFQPDLPSTVFVFAGRRNDRRDPTYSLDCLKKELEHCLTPDRELALHNGIGTWNDSGKLSQAGQLVADKFGRNIIGIRPHFLDCRFPDYWQNASAFKYSSSVGSDSLPGFTAGLNFPFFGFDNPVWRKLDILELPIGLMDCALFTTKEKTARKQLVDDLIGCCIANHGLLVIDWHNTSAYENDFPGWFEAFEYIISLAGEKGAYIGSLGQINDIWRARCVSVFSS